MLVLHLTLLKIKQIMEKTIFDYINSILFSKKKIDINIEDNSFILYLFNRWASMYSPELCYYVNEVLNNVDS